MNLESEYKKEIGKQAYDKVLEKYSLGYVDWLEEKLTEQLTLTDVGKQSELLAFKDWFNKLPEDSDDRLYLTNETISRFKANCG